MGSRLPGSKRHSRPTPQKTMNYPTATVILLRHAVALNTPSHYRFPEFGGVSKEMAPRPLKRPWSTYLCSSSMGCRTSRCLLEGVAVQGGCRSFIVACRAAMSYHACQHDYKIHSNTIHVMQCLCINFELISKPICVFRKQRRHINFCT